MAGSFFCKVIIGKQESLIGISVNYFFEVLLQQNLNADSAGNKRGACLFSKNNPILRGRRARPSRGSKSFVGKLLCTGNKIGKDLAQTPSLFRSYQIL
jgi:hypothetical protein